MVSVEHHSTALEDEDERTTMEKVKTLMHFPPYGTMGDGTSGDTCPTCRGTGRIPRGQQDQLVAVIPCNDVRLKPRRTKLYVCISIGVCTLICFLIVFFLFPRSVTLMIVSMMEVRVYFTNKTVELNVTNLINIDNQNYVPVHIVELNIQGLYGDTVLGNTLIKNVADIKPRSQKLCNVSVDLTVKDEGLNTLCRSSSAVHNIFVNLHMAMNVSYLSHTEVVSLDTYQYFDCGRNSTSPRPVR
ncbi:transmembrane protein 106A isoform 1-T1 [Pholidichthys leucotaenia]